MLRYFVELLFVLYWKLTAAADNGWLVCMQNAVEASKSRVINFAGEFEPVKWKCRAPLPNGTLCERMDRYKVSLQFVILVNCLLSLYVGTNSCCTCMLEADWSVVCC